MTATFSHPPREKNLAEVGSSRVAGGKKGSRLGTQRTSEQGKPINISGLEKKK
jgi:hypothetical protein